MEKPRWRKSSTLVILFLSFLGASCQLCSGAVQVVDKDSLSNLWIVTIDASGSMVWDANKRYRIKQKYKISQQVIQRLQKYDLEWIADIDYAKDHFLFFTSGLLKGRHFDIRKLNTIAALDSSFIHLSDTTLLSFKNQAEFRASLAQHIEKPTYSYQFSLVSLIRIFSLVKAQKYLQKQDITQDFNKIFLLSITDDADQNDQWLTDYKNVKKYAPAKLPEINATIDRYVFNPFNANTQGTGKFTELFYDNAIPHIILYEYSTLQAQNDTIKTSNLLEVQALSEDTVAIALTLEKLAGNHIDFVQVDSLYVNGSGSSINTRLLKSAPTVSSKASF